MTRTPADALDHRSASRLATFLVGVGALLAEPVPAQAPLPCELRGVWVATVDNIDWPSRPGLPVAQQKAELDRILDVSRDLRLNVVIFQVRPGCDALYASGLEPWSEWLCGRQGQAPEPAWDPLEHAVAGAHARGLQLHAWFNPYRARPAKSTSPMAQSHVSRTHPDRVVTYGKQLWLDPGHAEAQAHSLRVILDVVRRYDVDGVHIDDYFYPYPEKGLEFADDATWESFREGGGRLGRADWRRANVDRMVETIWRGVHREKPWVRFGISPFGVARPGVPQGITAGIDQYEQLYADARKWLREGWCDDFVPQLYWPIRQRAQSFPRLLEWWAAENVKGRNLAPGLYTSQLERAWRADEITEQIRIARTAGSVGGHVHFSARALLRDADGIARVLASGPYAQPALVPAATWLDRTPPGTPRVTMTRDGPAAVLRWEAVDDAWQWGVLGRNRDGDWRLLAILPQASRAWRATVDRGVTVLGVIAVDRCGNAGARAECPAR